MEELIRLDVTAVASSKSVPDAERSSDIGSGQPNPGRRSGACLADFLTTSRKHTVEVTSAGGTHVKAQDIMTANPACCTPDDTVQEAARLMQEHDCGCLPVVEDQESKRLVGVVTDRDLACRCLAEGKSPDTRVEEVMSADPSCCAPDDEIDEVERIMAERQVRRVPAIDEHGCCVGMVAQADLARRENRGISDREVGRVVERISEPTGTSRRDAHVGIRPEQRT